MTIGEANAFNVVCRFLGLHDNSGEPPTVDEAVSAFSTLAERSSTALGAGVSGGQIVSRRHRLAELLEPVNRR